MKQTIQYIFQSLPCPSNYRAEHINRHAQVNFSLAVFHFVPPGVCQPFLRCQSTRLLCWRRVSAVHKPGIHHVHLCHLLLCILRGHHWLLLLHPVRVLQSVLCVCGLQHVFWRMHRLRNRLGLSSKIYYKSSIDLCQRHMRGAFFSEDQNICKGGQILSSKMMARF